MEPDQPCPVPVDASIGALRAEVAALTPVIDQLGRDDLARATRLPGWDVQLLLAHLVRGVGRIGAYLTADIPPAPELDWIGYWTTAVTTADPDDVSERARAFAATLNDRPVPHVWRETTAEALRMAEVAPPGRVLPSPFGAMRVDHYLTSRVVEVTVHGLDLRAALALEEIATPSGLAVTTAVLDALLDDQRPVDVADDLAFVLAATGRAPSDDPRLPLVS